MVFLPNSKNIISEVNRMGDSSFDDLHTCNKKLASKILLALNAQVRLEEPKKLHWLYEQSLLLKALEIERGEKQ